MLGVAFALGQHDLKRLLAYHSIENIGIIVIGLGLAVLGRTLRPAKLWIVLGLSGCLLHVWNHALFKSLLFLSAGSVIHARHTREIDHLGGLAKSDALDGGVLSARRGGHLRTAAAQWIRQRVFDLHGLFHTLGLGNEPGFPAAAFAVPALALMGALAVACFVKVFGVVFLGVSRVAAAARRPTSRLDDARAACACWPRAAWRLDWGRRWSRRCSIARSRSGAANPRWPRRPLAQTARRCRNSAWRRSSSSAALALGAAAAAAGASALSRWAGRRPGAAATPARRRGCSTRLVVGAVSGHAVRLGAAADGPSAAAGPACFRSRRKFESHVPEVVLDRAVLPAFRLRWRGCCSGSA